MANFDNYLRISLRRMAGLALFTFCHHFVQIGNQSAAQPQKIYTICWLTLLLFLTHKPSPLHPSSPLNHKPMLAPSRNTTEQQSDIGDVELGNDSGSLSAGRKQLITISWRGLTVKNRRLLRFNSSLPFSPHAPMSALQQFAAVLPSRAEVHPPTVRCCSPLTH